ncbi:uncharacterized protein LAESUDRAFT_749104 [Laetiporus sulphureus 93-53]|uniref:Uncharacterized protein n=1 Tax=Laetiporus sulphureus 93-53 TaxID=1314785 RepID=A0A165F340_9APHY|nr:uncharacterized protein LAESUDRAFT_749104 [Laetiporus sulphureus 93-53]KZT08275.1 hypothetical protein LAESUDRAFT_749104 [Laetiporus sulphureus 93-53]
MYKFAEFRRWTITLCDPVLIEEVRRRPEAQLSQMESNRECSVPTRPSWDHFVYPQIVKGELNESADKLRHDGRFGTCGSRESAVLQTRRGHVGAKEGTGERGRVAILDVTWSIVGAKHEALKAEVMFRKRQS